MHFSKAYSQLLLNLPPELRENAIEYRQLKKIIHEIVLELTSLGLNPSSLHDLLDDGGHQHKIGTPRLVYEFNAKAGKIVPQLRLSIGPSEENELPSTARITSESSDTLAESDNGESEPSATGHTSLVWALQRPNTNPDGLNSEAIEVTTSNNASRKEVVIPLVSDTAFFRLLCTTLQTVSQHLEVLRQDFSQTLKDLSRQIGDSARPAHYSPHFHPLSRMDHPGTIPAPKTPNSNKSDLYSWREIFKLYVESEIFEGISEAHRGEHSVEETEKRLQFFAERVTGSGLHDRQKLKLAQSRDALETFLELNLFILNIKRLQLANSEATRKILKKHAKRTALPLPGPDIQHSPDVPDDALSLILSPLSSSTSLPRLLVQAIGEVLLPVIPHIDDYSCLICTSIAFKPIRLQCGHLFCVRCLVKMQKRGQDNCPMCRAQTVLIANKSNVDWALLNFLQDWFPEESKEKLKQNEREANAEQMAELGVDPNVLKCIVM